MAAGCWWTGLYATSDETRLPTLIISHYGEVIKCDRPFSMQNHDDECVSIHCGQWFIHRVNRDSYAWVIKTINYIHHDWSWKYPMVLDDQSILEYSELLNPFHPCSDFMHFSNVSRLIPWSPQLTTHHHHPVLLPSNPSDCSCSWRLATPCPSARCRRRQQCARATGQADRPGRGWAMIEGV